jgi:hypothetical protein
MSDNPPTTPPDPDEPDPPPVDEPKEEPPPPAAVITGGGAATVELEELRERVRHLETGRSWKPAEPVRRMIPLWGAANGIDGRAPMVP